MGKTATFIGIFQALAATVFVDVALIALSVKLGGEVLPIPAAITLGAIASATAPAATLSQKFLFQEESLPLQSLKTTSKNYGCSGTLPHSSLLLAFMLFNEKPRLKSLFIIFRSSTPRFCKS